MFQDSRRPDHRAAPTVGFALFEARGFKSRKWWIPSGSKTPRSAGRFPELAEQLWASEFPARAGFHSMRRVLGPGRSGVSRRDLPRSCPMRRGAIDLREGGFSAHPPCV